VYEKVPTLPEEITRAEEHIAALEARSRQLEEAIASESERFAQVQADTQAAKEDLAATRQMVSTLDQLKSDVDDIVRSFPLDLVARAPELPNEARDEVHAAARSLRTLADLLDKVGTSDA
jgi:ABC-type transporter Mla subunit MlaD